MVELGTIWLQEFGKHDKEPAKFIKQWTGNNSRTGAPFSCDVGYERFLAPEVWPNLMLHTLFLISFCQLVRRKCMFMTLCMSDVVCIRGGKLGRILFYRTEGI